MPTLSKDELLLKEGFLFQATSVTPQLIGETGGGDPFSHFTNVVSLGYAEAGSVVVNIAREYAIAESDTPRITLRQDLTKKTYSFTFNSLQITNADLWALRDGLDVKKGYTDGLFVGDVARIGPEEPPAVEQAYILKTFDVNDIPYYYAIYTGRVVSEDISETRSGDSHVSVPATIMSFPNSNFDLTVRAEKQRAYGAKWTDKS